MKETTVEASEICQIQSHWNESDKFYPPRGPFKKILDLDTEVSKATEPIYIDGEVNRVPGYVVVQGDDWDDEDGIDDNEGNSMDDELLKRLRVEIRDITDQQINRKESI